MSSHRVQVTGLAPWIEARRLLGPEFVEEQGTWCAELAREDAADLAARLRGLGFGGALDVFIRPGLKRTAVREGRTRDARLRRDTTPGFTRPGARLDDEGRMSLTPEVLALELGRCAPDVMVYDLTCGCGGNAIGFARAGRRVVAVERSSRRLEMARHNAQLYGVSDRIRFCHGDALEHLPEDGLVFVDPPWGGDWNKQRTTLDDLPLLASILERRSHDLWAKVPPSFDARTVRASAKGVFGHAPGDRQRVKYVLLTFSA